VHVEPRGRGAAANDLAGEGLGAGGVAALGGVADLFFFEWGGREKGEEEDRRRG